ncbi:MAG: hypothetical protein O2816_11325 [Planctomycetota bacterium]|nr:hypothetical protein [Planctomycetota bacterium]
MSLVAVRELDDLLRARGQFTVGSRRAPWLALCTFIVVAGPLYGLVMGSYAGSGRQALYAASKMPLLLGLSSLVCLPNFFILNTVLGLREDFPAACRGLLAAQATMAVTLLALAPLVALAYVSGVSYPGATLCNGIALCTASGAAQVTLARHYRPLIDRDPRHRHGLVAWLVLYVFVAVQLAWLLRPFIGSPDMGVRFLRENAFQSNAHVELVHLASLLTR